MFLLSLKSLNRHRLFFEGVYFAIEKEEEDLSLELELENEPDINKKEETKFILAAVMRMEEEA